MRKDDLTHLNKQADDQLRMVLLANLPFTVKDLNSPENSDRSAIFELGNVNVSVLFEPRRPDRFEVCVTDKDGKPFAENAFSIPLSSEGIAVLSPTRVMALLNEVAERSVNVSSARGAR